MTYTGSDARIGTRLTVKIPPKLIKASATSPINSIVEGHVDLGITSVFSDKNVAFIPLFKYPARLIVSSNHPLASNDEISAESLDGCDLIYIPDIGNDVIQAVKKVYDFKFASPFSVHSDVGAISMVDLGLGSYIISELQCIRLGNNTKKIKFKEPVYRTMGIGVLKHKLQIPIIKEMIQFAIDFSKDFEKELWSRCKCHKKRGCLCIMQTLLFFILS
ncbi:MAG: LysR family transcriptional regulator substrate-binding protein [Emergencia timonensis]|uniref:LysR family transcriptional regulator substrate-binding protein n=1 Tax=Emergencia timonensis TaxID=1776384 RepID=UPI0008304E23